MTTPSPSPTPRRRWHGWLPLALTAILTIPLVALVWWSQRDPKFAPVLDSNNTRVVQVPRRPPLPLPETAIREPFGPLHIVVADDFENVQVVRIRAKAEGDELIIDAKTGKLLAVRDHLGHTIRLPIAETGPAIKAS